MKCDVQALSEKRWLILLLAIVILPFELNGFYNPVLAETPPLYWTLELLSWFVLPAVIYGFGVRRKLFTNEQIGFHLAVGSQRNPALLVLAIVAISAVLYWTYHGAVSVSQTLFPINYGKVSFNYKRIVPSAGALHWLTVIYFSLTAGFVEEIYCRALFRRLFGGNFGSVICYIILSSLLFSLGHWEGGVQALFGACCFGLVASSLYVWTKNLWPLVIGHCLVDFLWLK